MKDLPIHWAMYAVTQNTIMLEELAKIRANQEGTDWRDILNDIHKRQDEFYNILAVTGLNINLEKGGLEA